MIQINLLPDVKLEYIKAQRIRRLVTSVSIVVSIVAVFILILVVGVGIAQKKHLSDLNKDVASYSSKLKNEPSISKVLTVQNQLNSLTGLHSTKPAVYNLFNSYLNELTPPNVVISTLDVNFAGGAAADTGATNDSMIITGSSTDLATVDQYIDTLKFTTFKAATGSSISQKAFSGVVLSDFGINPTPQSADEAVSYTINVNFNPAIFSITAPVTLTVPSQITTRSDLEDPGVLFKTEPTTKSVNGGS
jgi:hypothetical protein